MKYQEIKQAMTEKLSKFSAFDLKNQIIEMNNDFRDGVDMVHAVALEVLCSKIPESEFLAFCETI